MTRTYRRRRGRHVWHLWWPEGEQVAEERTQDTRPGDLCNECRAKERRDAAQA